jgi:prophage regulatory protein
VETNQVKSEHQSARAPKAVRIPGENESVDQLLRMPQIIAVTGFSRATIFRMIKRGDFPPPIRFGKRMDAWRWGTIRSHLRSSLPDTT